ncbi:hypothetical protein HDU81_010332 [Chytriomyces hyalinus]|nr:hypothetical protein HDU81_010332 [Chytriomyces hyalinus]
MLPLHRTTSSTTFGARGPTINPRARGVHAFDGDDAKGMKKRPITPTQIALFVTSNWKQLSAVLSFGVLLFVLRRMSNSGNDTGGGVGVPVASAVPTNVPVAVVAESPAPLAPVVAGPPKLEGPKLKEKTKEKVNDASKNSPKQQIPPGGAVVPPLPKPPVQPPKPENKVTPADPEVSLDLSAFDDSRSLPMDPSEFLKIKVPTLVSNKELTPALRKKVWDARAQAVTRSFSHAWDGYVKYAWESDELKPNSKTGNSWLNMGITILDALDTALVMKNQTIFAKAAKWVLDGGLAMDANVNANVFETTIRVIGGLLSAHHLAENGPEKDGLLKQAVRVADKFMPAFTSSQSGIPYNSVNLKDGKATSSDAFFSSTSEATTVQLELKFLSHLTGDPKYWNAAQKVSQVLFQSPSDKTAKYDGLVPIYIDPKTGNFNGLEFRLGSRADSYYEYLAKQYLLTNETEPFFLAQYRTALHKGIKKHLLMRSQPSNLLYIREHLGALGPGGRKDEKFDHLVCYFPGTLALTATKGKRVPSDPIERAKILTGQEMEELYMAEELAQSCFEMYHQTASGLAPEIVFWKPAKDAVSTAKELERTWARFETSAPSRDNSVKLPIALETVKKVRDGEIMLDFDIHTNDKHNLLRPEAVESFFVLYRITGDEKYREWGWNIFRSFEQWSKVATGGYTSLHDVNTIPPPPRDKMESFFLGETLKYFYLLFSDDAILPLDQYVFNTECHPFPIFQVSDELKKQVSWMQ